MTIKHNSASGKTTITLSWTETRQFIDVSSVQQNVAKRVGEIVAKTAPAPSAPVGFYVPPSRIKNKLI